ncbi:MAG: hypothetical protein MJ174_07450 [Treponema sp.]|nr:hypothetical protein [Treponema sp.]
MSNELIKNLFGDNTDIVNAFSKIDAIKFKYNEKAHSIAPNGENGIDADVHIGVKAQDLAKNPVTASTVIEDENGFLAVDTGELTLANSAVLSEICKRIEVIENILGVKTNG